jgi:hypothetical protein
MICIRNVKRTLIFSKGVFDYTGEPNEQYLCKDIEIIVSCKEKHFV